MIAVPYQISNRGGQYCVTKKPEGTVVPGGCHASRGDAVRHMRALYAAEDPKTKKASR